MLLHTEIEIVVGPIAHPCLPKWRARVDWAEKRGGFTESQRRAARDWDQCANGEAHLPAEMTHAGGGTPLDPRLRSLGRHFASAVGDNDYTQAREIITQIETRL